MLDNFTPIYELRLDERTVAVDHKTWALICDYVNESIWFYLVHKGVTYKYYKTQVFFDRPSRYDFVGIDPNEESPIRYIYI